MKTVLDTRDLIEKRDELKQQILDAFLEDFEHYVDRTDSFEDILFEEEELENFKDYWKDELEEIENINEIEDEIGSEFDYGCTLIHEDSFQEYCEELLEELGYVPKDFPTWIEIDYEATSENMKQDYSELVYDGENYFYRA